MKTIVVVRADVFAKSHVSGYTRKDGTYVAEHEDKRSRKVDPKSTSSMAEAIADHAHRMGFEVDHKSSQLSGSNYVHVRHHQEDRDEPEDYTIRVADHQLPAAHKNEHGAAHFEVSPKGREHDDTSSTNWQDALDYLSRKTGVPIPKELVASRNAAAGAAKRNAEKATQKYHAALDADIAKLHTLLSDESVVWKRSGSKRSGWLEKDGVRVGAVGQFGLTGDRVPSDKQAAIQNMIANYEARKATPMAKALVLFVGSVRA